MSPEPGLSHLSDQKSLPFPDQSDWAALNLGAVQKACIMPGSEPPREMLRPGRLHALEASCADGQASLGASTFNSAPQSSHMPSAGAEIIWTVRQCGQPFKAGISNPCIWPAP